MSLELKIRGQQSATHLLADAAFTKMNYGVNTNATLAPLTPVGILGGSVAAQSADNYVAEAANGANTVLGLFYHNAQGAAFDNAPAIASGKVTIIQGQAVVEVDTYETRNAADSADITYAVGEMLYSSAQGLLTNEKPTDVSIVNGVDQVIGVVTAAPAQYGDALGINLRL